MFVQFILPFPVRGDKFAYEWVIYRALSKMGYLGLLAPSHYWTEIGERLELDVWANQPSTRSHYGYRLPTIADLQSLPKFPLCSNLLEALEKKFLSSNLAWAQTVKTRIPVLEAAIEGALRDAGGIEAFLLWTNCPSLKKIARSKGIPTIHHEVGPLRPPYFRLTGYLDFEGVNGQTQAHQRWLRFIAEKPDVPVLSREALLDLLKLDLPEFKAPVSCRRGVALQLSDDSNILAFSRGFTNFELITASIRHLPNGRPLVRSHPVRGEHYDGLPVDWDDSVHPSEFLGKISELVTINSSLAFESMLLGKPTYVLGDSPFRTGSWNFRTGAAALSNRQMLRWLNWMVFAYLVPFELTFDKNYLLWRLSGPTETEIYTDNFKRWNALVQAQ